MQALPLQAPNPTACHASLCRRPLTPTNNPQPHMQPYSHSASSTPTHSTHSNSTGSYPQINRSKNSPHPHPHQPQRHRPHKPQHPPHPPPRGAHPFAVASPAPPNSTHRPQPAALQHPGAAVHTLGAAVGLLRAAMRGVVVGRAGVAGAARRVPLARLLGASSRATSQTAAAS